ncbi:TetR/AcrR family transcriptional regulator [Pseudonocardia endophytica]|uniref:TetR family transcriptional regulator n=1 Tax=Pseudonocardia endophytica TaxID=401976 RepID=A0A4R1HY18_PSEEN|nr:TetR/AcrR family transcriptional regulator [Pseudonocardia endophytica]TCK24969.1 TetR family transcriptional regulator [Pseudonocardia endophytica]
MTEDGLLVRISAREPEEPGGKRAAIVRAATTLFLRGGFQATSTEQIATAAAVSKQTVYNQFGDKKALFEQIVLGVTATAEAFTVDLVETLEGVETAADLEPTLRSLARRYLSAVISPDVMALRRLVISEAARFPDLAAGYHDRAPARVLDAIAGQFARLGERGFLDVPDPATAASDFAFLLVGRPLDEGMFRPAGEVLVDVDAAADHAVDVVLAVYRRR